MSMVFYGCSGLTSLDVSNFNTAQVTNMVSMFDGCSGLTSLDVSNFNTSKVKDMRYVFEDCSSLTSLDVSNFNTENVEQMEGLFRNCTGLTSLDVSRFNTAKVKSMTGNPEYVPDGDKHGVFYGCSKLTTIYCNDAWSCERSQNLFTGCTALKGAISYNSSMTDVNYANPTTGYFTAVTEGDANADNKITDEDVEVVANRLMLDKTNTTSKFVFAGADSNGDKEVNVVDIVDIINKKE